MLNHIQTGFKKIFRKGSQFYTTSAAWQWYHLFWNTKPILILSNAIHSIENIPTERPSHSKKGKGGKVDQLNSVFHAIHPGGFDGSAEKHSRSKAPSSEPINPMAPTAKHKQQRSSAKVSIPRIHTIAVADYLDRRSTSAHLMLLCFWFPLELSQA